MSGERGEDFETVLDILRLSDGLSLNFNPGVGVEIRDGLVGADVVLKLNNERNNDDLLIKGVEVKNNLSKIF